MSDTLEVIKQGETSFTMTLLRSPAGLTVAVKTHPSIETFMRGLGSGEQVSVKAAGPYWRTLREADPPLLYYQMSEAIPNLQMDNGSYVTISRPGSMLMESVPGFDGKPRQSINLSFLRLVGVSEGAGLTFGVRGVHTFEAIQQMKDQIGMAYRHLYRSLMKPIKIDIIVSTQAVVL